MKPRIPRHLIAKGAVRVTIANGSVILADEHGLILHIHEAVAVQLIDGVHGLDDCDVDLYGHIPDEPRPN